MGQVHSMALRQQLYRAIYCVFLVSKSNTKSPLLTVLLTH